MQADLEEPEPELLLVEELREPASEGPAPAPATEPVLVVDDDPSIVRLYGDYLSTRGFEVQSAADGEQAMARALARRYELVITDLSMPRLDGWGLIQRLREDARTREVPILVLSAVDDFRDTLQAEDVGAAAYLPKGLRLPELLMRVQALLAPRREFRTAAREGRACGVTPAMDPTFAIRELAAARFTGCLGGRDELASYRVFFRAGQPVHAEGLAPPHKAEGEGALYALVASRTFTGKTFPGLATRAASIRRPLEAFLTAAHTQLNDLARHHREELVAHGQPRQINRERYRLLSRIGPARMVEIAHLVCGLRMSTAEVIRATSQSPGDVVVMIEELIRRGLVTMGDAG